MDPAEGGCLCGAVRYRLVGEPRALGRCHCVSCRRASGAPSVAWVVVAKADFSFVTAEPAAYRSSPPVIRAFCGKCGTPLTYHHDDSPETIDVTKASFDEPERFAPVREIWLEDKIPWEPVNETLPHFQRTSREM
jgi:hypothetical protein